jgi:hypothetical protein
MMTYIRRRNNFLDNTRLQKSALCVIDNIDIYIMKEICFEVVINASMKFRLEIPVQNTSNEWK